MAVRESGAHSVWGLPELERIPNVPACHVSPPAPQPYTNAVAPSWGFSEMGTLQPTGLGGAHRHVDVAESHATSADLATLAPISVRVLPMSPVARIWSVPRCWNSCEECPQIVPTRDLGGERREHARMKTRTYAGERQSMNEARTHINDHRLPGPELSSGLPKPPSFSRMS
jgi:hypothetical protein